MADIGLLPYALVLVIIIVITTSLMYVFPKRSQWVLTAIEEFMCMHEKILANRFFLIVKCLEKLDLFEGSAIVQTSSLSKNRYP